MKNTKKFNTGDKVRIIADYKINGECLLGVEATVTCSGTEPVLLDDNKYKYNFPYSILELIEKKGVKYAIY